MQRTPQEAREAILRSGIPITQWAMAHGFSPALVFEVLSGRRRASRGQSHRIAVALGLKEGEIVTDPRRALQ